MNHVPSVSVVIPTQNRQTFLLQCLAALAHQSCPPDRFDVTVVADGCTDDTERALSGAAYPFALRVVSQPASGAAAARNRGVVESTGKLLIFIDDDVIPSPGLISAHDLAHMEPGARIGVGPYLLDPPARDDFFGQINHRWWTVTFRDIATATHADYRHVLGGNLSMWRTTFELAGGFDPGFLCCEDPEFGIRLLERGVRPVFVPDARARHLETTDVDRSFQRAALEGRAHVLLATRHPAVVPTLPLARRASITRLLVFRLPPAGMLLREVGRGVLTRLQGSASRRSYEMVYGLLRRVWYWQGVIEGAGSAAGWRRIIEHTDPTRRPDAGDVHSGALDSGKAGDGNR